MRWLDEVRLPVAEVAQRLGLDGDARRGLPCPACGVERRDRRRGAVGLRGDGQGWRCHRCGEGGDGFDLVAWRLCGRRFRDLDADGRAAVRAWFGAAEPVGVPQVEPAAGRPPLAEVEALWRAALPLSSCLPDGAFPDTRAARFLRGRGLLDRGAIIDAADLARLAPPADRHPWPAWWPRGRSFLWRLMVRAFEPDGRLASLHARAVEERPIGREGEPMPKTLWPGARQGPRYDAGGLFFADPAALDVLRGDGGDVRRLLVCEGLTDWLSAAAWARASGQVGLGVIGGVSGSFPALAKVRLPADLDLIIAVDDDDAGRRYLDQVRRALPGRSVRRLVLGAAA